MLRLLLIVSLAAIFSADSLCAASIEGHVTLPKAPAPAVISQRYEVVSQSGVISVNPPLAIVYLEGKFERTADPKVEQMKQHDFTFYPAVLPIQVGTRVEFPNEDDAYHNIFSYSAPKRFDLGRYRKDEHPVPSEVFDKAGLVTLRCDIHEHMRAIILVLETPHFVLSGPDGNFRLSDVPAGRYVLKAWINSKTTLERPIEIPPDGVLRVDFP
ncbi:MAG: carboxypeptidase regulatory-like domain-containing protein [Nibricoccus sp.]